MSGSAPVCIPYLATEKLASRVRPDPSFAIQSSIGTVIMGAVPALRLCEMKVSPRSPATGLSSGMLSKKKSSPRLSPLTCQL